MSADERDQLTGAFKAMEDHFRDAGGAETREQQSRARKRRWFGQRALGPVLGGVAAFLGVAGVSIGTAMFTANEGQTGGDPHGPAEARHAVGDVFRGDAVSRDPTQRGKLWGVGVYPSANRRDTCILAGTVHGATLGREINGKFARFGNSFPGACDDMRRNHLVFRTRNYCAATGSRTILFGVADRIVTRLLLGKPPALRDLAIATDGTFIAVQGSPNALTGQVLRIEFAGRRRPWLIQLQPPRRRPHERGGSGTPPPTTCAATP